MEASLLNKNFPDITSQVNRLETLALSLQKTDVLQERLEILSNDEKVKKYFIIQGSLDTLLLGLSLEEELVFKAVVATGQAERLFQTAFFKSFFDQLLPVERFYKEVGGIVGYHWMMLKLFMQESNEAPENDNFLRAEGVDLAEENALVRQAILWGIQHLPEMAEIYALGGAADRLRLYDERTGVALPAARLLFCGKTLLEGMITDVQAREYLHYKLYGKRCLTPIAMMTSYEKENHAHIVAICEKNAWFGRPKDSYRLFSQPGVPTVDRKGNWCLQGPGQLLLKPGGHGVIWKLARESGVLEWMLSQGKPKALVRQVNNPIAGIDFGILAFTGVGLHEDKHFGFASCPRLVGAKEGINVLIEKKKGGAFEYVLTNIEYCDFERYQLIDEVVGKGSPFSKFPSNTNILFVDLKEILATVERCPFPGKIVNFKKATYRTDSGENTEEEIARLESTMQNIADYLGEAFPSPLQEGERDRLRTYLTYNKRHKTISAAKQEFVLGSSLLETPEGCFLDFLKNARELLEDCCQMRLPSSTVSIEHPAFLFIYHPALGPIYSIISQKIRRGELALGSELQLQIAEIDVEDLELKGSLCIEATAIMGHIDQGILHYSTHTGKCVLKNVRVHNQGIDYAAPNVFWRNTIFRNQYCRILIHGNGEFYAEDVTLEGQLEIEVLAGTRVIATQKEGKLCLFEEKITTPTWHWSYHIGDDYQILLNST